MLYFLSVWRGSFGYAQYGNIRMASVLRHAVEPGTFPGDVPSPCVGVRSSHLSVHSIRRYPAYLVLGAVATNYLAEILRGQIISESQFCSVGPGKYEYDNSKHTGSRPSPFKTKSPGCVLKMGSAERFALGASSVFTGGILILFVLNFMM